MVKPPLFAVLTHVREFVFAGDAGRGFATAWRELFERGPHSPRSNGQGAYAPAKP